MVRHGMLTIGVAVQAETFSDNNNNSNNHGISIANLTGNSSSPAIASSSTKSAIFLPPSRNSAPQTLKITFSYNKESNLPEISVNFNEEGAENQQHQYLQLKELKPSGSSNSLTKKSVISSDYPNKANAVQIYYFERIDKPYTTQIFEIPPSTVSSPNPQAIEYSAADEEEFGMKPETETSSAYISPQGVWKLEEKSNKFTDNANANKPRIVIEKVEDDDDGKLSNSKEADNPPPSPLTPSSSSSSSTQESKDDHGGPPPHEGVKKVDGEKDNNGKSSSNKEKSDTGSSGSNKSSGSKGNARHGARRKTKASSNSNNSKAASEEHLVEKRSAADGRFSPTKDIHERSKIPVINSAATGFMSCEYYRQKWLQEMGCTDPSSWGGGYTAIQKTAGQKVPMIDMIA
jgi:hypothetical protein